MPTYERGDYVKVEFPDETTGIGEMDVGPPAPWGGP